MWVAHTNPPAVALTVAYGCEDTRRIEDCSSGRNTPFSKPYNDLEFEIPTRTMKLVNVKLQCLFADPEPGFAVSVNDVVGLD